MKIKEIQKKYGNRVILDGITSEFHTGMNFIIGDSGEGKSTLLNILGSLDTYDKGSIEFSGYDISSHFKDEYEYRSEIVSFVFQDSNFINGLTVLDNIKIAASMSENPMGDSEIEELLMKFNIWEFRNEKVDYLSGGEKQRVALVRALAKNSKIILADEPTGSLDSENTEIVFECLKEISEGRIVIIITHNKEKAFKYGDAIFVLKNGKINNLRVSKNDNIQVKLPIRQANRKTVISNKFVKKLTNNSIRRHIGKFVSMATTLAVVGMLCASTYMLKTNVKKNQDNLNYTYYDMDLVDVYSENYQDAPSLSVLLLGYESRGFTEEEINKICNNDLFDAIVPYSGAHWYSTHINDKLNIKPILLNNFFSDRIMTEAIEGEFPSSDYEMIIGEDLADKIFDGNAIGQKLQISDEYGNVLELNIVGVNHQKNVDGFFYNYINSELMIGNIKQPYTQTTNIFSNTTINAIESLENGNISVSADTGGFILSEKAVLYNVYGKQTCEYGEIIIGKSVFQDLYRSISGENIDVENMDFNEFTIEQKNAIDKVFAEKCIIAGNDVYEVDVVGVHNGPEYEVLVNDDYYNIINSILPTVLQCYVKDIYHLQDIIKMDTIDGYSFYSYYGERFEAVEANNQMLNIIFVILSLFTVIVFILVINSFVKVSFADKVSEIGLLKSLGARKKDVYRILIADNVALGGVAGILGVLLFVVFISIINNVLDMNINNWKMFTMCLVILYIAPIVVSFFMCSIKTRKIIEETPADTLRRK